MTTKMKDKMRNILLNKAMQTTGIDQAHNREEKTNQRVLNIRTQMTKAEKIQKLEQKCNTVTDNKQLPSYHLLGLKGTKNILQSNDYPNKKWKKNIDNRQWNRNGIKPNY